MFINFKETFDKAAAHTMGSDKPQKDELEEAYNVYVLERGEIDPATFMRRRRDRRLEI